MRAIHNTEGSSVISILATKICGNVKTSHSTGTVSWETKVFHLPLGNETATGSSQEKFGKQEVWWGKWRSSDPWKKKNHQTSDVWILRYLAIGILVLLRTAGRTTVFVFWRIWHFVVPPLYHHVSYSRLVWYGEMTWHWIFYKYFSESKVW